MPSGVKLRACVCHNVHAEVSIALKIHQYRLMCRKSYRHVADFRDALVGVPFMALTATATLSMLEDVKRVLHCCEQGRLLTVVRSSFARSNLFLSVIGKKNGGPGKGQLLKLIRPYVGAGKCGIVYARTRAETMQIYKCMKARGMCAHVFHAGLDAARKADVQRWWADGGVGVIVATVAFGLGIAFHVYCMQIHYERGLCRGQQGSTAIGACAVAVWWSYAGDLARGKDCIPPESRQLLFAQNSPGACDDNESL